MEKDDDVAMNKAVPFDIVLSDEAASWSDMAAVGKGQYYRFGPEVVTKT